MGYVRPLAVVLAVQILLAGLFVALVATENVPFVNYDSDAAPAAVSRVDRFDSKAAWRLLKEQAALGPRPAGSAASRQLAARLKKLLPDGRYQSVPVGLRNVVGTVKGRSRRYVVIGAHTDTKETRGLGGPNAGAPGTAVLTQLARSFARSKKPPRHTLIFVLFDGEESPGSSDDGGEARFEREGLRGSKVAARRWRKAEAMVLLDFVGDRQLSTPGGANPSGGVGARLGAGARRVGVASHFPP